MASRYDFVSIGAYTKDTIVTRSGTRYVDGGGYSYSAHAARLAGVSVGAVTRLAAEDRKSTDLLRSVGVEVIVHESRHSTLMRLEYPTDNVDERILTVAAVADAFVPADVASIDAGAILISPSIRGEVPLAVVEAVRAKAGRVGLDVQGFVRIRTENGQLAYEAWPEIRQVLALRRRAEVGRRRRRVPDRRARPACHRAQACELWPERDRAHAQGRTRRARERDDSCTTVFADASCAGAAAAAILASGRTCHAA